MTHSIHSLGRFITPPAQPAPPSEPAAPPARPAQPSPPPAAAARSDVATPLTDAEQTMIDRYFPAAPTMELRLYGPGQQRKTVTPEAVGKHLDLRA